MEQESKNVLNYYLRLKRFVKYFNAIESLQETYFITLTQNSKMGKDRSNFKKFLYNIKAAYKNCNEPILYILEKHKSGDYHAHAITDKKMYSHLLKHYKAGYMYSEEIQGNIYNEMVKYMTKRNENYRSYYANKSCRNLKAEYNKKIKMERQKVYLW